MGNEQSEQSEQPQPDDELVFKIVMVGNGNVGKSSLLSRYVENRFPIFEVLTTLNIAFLIRRLEIDGQQIKLQLWDTFGEERFRALTRSYYRGSHGVVVVFDLTDVESFNAAKSWIEEAEDVCGGDITKVLLGNKSDLTETRAVSHDTAKEFAEQVGIPYFETSAKTGENVVEAFMGTASGMKNRVDNGTLEAPRPVAVLKPGEKPYKTWMCSCS